MALPTASDNVFPKIILSAETEPATPDAGEAKLFLDTSDSLLKWKDDGGTVYPIGTAPTNIEDYATAETDDTLVLAPDGAGGVEFRAEAGGGGSIAWLHYQDQKSQNTSGGTFSSGAWRTRDLNTEVVDSGNNGSLASNQVTLAAGTYVVWAHCPAYQCYQHQARLYNITGTAVLLLGSSAISATGVIDQSDSFIYGVIVLGGTTVVELQHQCASTFSTQGFGVEANLTTEVYADLLLLKVA